MAKMNVLVMFVQLAIVDVLSGESNCGKLSRYIQTVSRSIYCALYSIHTFLVIYNNPRTMVVLKNDTAFLCCEVNTQSGNNIYILFNRKVTSISVNVTEYMNRGIIWKAYEDGVKTAFNISVLATEENNGLTIQCGFGGCLTEEAEVIVVDAW